MNRKPGQPDNPLEITAGRRAVLNQLDAGIADQSAQAHAANWLRDLARHYSLPNTYLTSDRCYRELMAGTCTEHTSQKIVLDWIYMLLAAPPHFNEVDFKMATIPSGEANDRQHGGDHYKKRKIQHWDFVSLYGYEYLPGQITKYVFRWQDKGGSLDIEKATHFLDKLMETKSATLLEPISLVEFLTANEITGDEALVWTMIHCFHESGNLDYLHLAKEALGRLLAVARTLT